MKITMVGKRSDGGEVPSLEVEVPAIPRIGEYIAVDNVEGLNGRVRNVMYWWGEEGEFVIEVQL